MPRHFDPNSGRLRAHPELEAMTYSPHIVRLQLALDTITDHHGCLAFDPWRGALDIECDPSLPAWAEDAIMASYDLLVLWWRRSPYAILSCPECGEVQGVADASRAGKRCTRSAKHRAKTAIKDRYRTVETGCEGRLQLLRIPLADGVKRPSGRKVRR